MFQKTMLLIVAAAAGMVLWTPSAPGRGKKKSPGKIAAVKRSANAGKTGLYQVDVTDSDQVKCHTVYVPDSYSERNPAGIYVFIHGMGGGKGGMKMPGKNICDKFNLIGIAPSIPKFVFGAGLTEQATQLVKAIAQVRADYNITPGRGMIASFSAGGLVHGELFKITGAKRGPSFPFHCSQTAGSSWQRGAKGGSPEIAWIFSIGQTEWGTKGRGSRMFSCSRDRFAAVAKGAAPDATLLMIVGGGHSWHKICKSAADEAFVRADLALNAFLWEPAYDKKLQKLVAKANKLQLASAAKDLEKLMAGDMGDEVKTQAEEVKKKLDQRIESIFTVTKGLSENDPILCDYYGQKYLKQLKGHPRGKELQALVGSVKKQLPAARKAYGTFVKGFPKFFTADSAKLNAHATKMLETVVEKCGENSQAGTMAAQYLQCK